MKKFVLALTAGAAFLATSANAAIPVYPTPGAVNAADYTFTAASTGNVVAYFANNGAGFTNLLGLLVNGVDTGIEGLNNQTSALGQSLNFGPVNAGDVLTFRIRVTNTGDLFYSERARNSDGITHIWSTAYAGGDFGIPAGTFVGFEDLNGGGDRDYDDLGFVFTNVRAGVPEPAAWAMMLGGFGLVGSAMRRRSKVAVTYA